MFKFFFALVSVLICIYRFEVCTGSDDEIDYFDAIVFGSTTSKIRSKIDIDIDDLFAVTSAECSEGGKCVPYYLCNSETQKANGLFLISSQTPKNPCSPLEMCCEKANYIHPEISTTLNPSFVIGSCGIHNKNGLGGMVQVLQNETQFGEFPWMVLVLTIKKAGSRNLYMYVCGGSLIHPKIVLTSAHNTANKDINKLLVRAGEWETQTRGEIFDHQERNIEKTFYHEDFDEMNMHNDIALLFLTESFELAPHINPICLPSPADNIDGNLCFASGWGRKKFGRKNEYSIFLKKILLPIVHHDDCQDKLRDTILGIDFELHDGFLCAGGKKNADMCTGDGGGPLVCEIKGHPGFFHQVGIVSWGISCGEDGVPGVYTDVVKYRDWIDERIKKENISIQSYTLK